MRKLWTLALLCAGTGFASDIDCILSACGFGSLSQTMTNSNILPADGSFPGLTETTITNVYHNNGTGVYAYTYGITVSSPSPVLFIFDDVYGRSAFDATILDFGVISDLTISLNDCGDTAGVGCTSLVLYSGFYGNNLFQANQGFQGQSTNGDAFGTGISSPAASTSNTFAFYLTSLGQPVGGQSEIQFVTAGGEGGGGAPTVLVPLATSAIPEPQTLISVPSLLLFLSCIRRRSFSRLLLQKRG